MYRQIVLSVLLPAMVAANPLSASAANTDAADSAVVNADRGDGLVDWGRAIARNQTGQLTRNLARQRAAGNIDARATDGKTAVMAAAAAGDHQLLASLLSAGANPMLVNYKGASALLYAAHNGSVAVLSMLIAAGARLEQSASNGWTAMTMAAAKGHVAAIRRLLRAGARVDPPDVYGWTPLMRAGNLGRVQAARVLVEEGGASLTRINSGGRTALHLAAAAGHRALYEMLLEQGGNDQIADARGLTARDIAVQQFGRDAVSGAVSKK